MRIGTRRLNRKQLAGMIGVLVVSGAIVWVVQAMDATARLYDAAERGDL
jgi:hypothetical protein